jgi:hypothetical protein
MKETKGSRFAARLREQFELAPADELVLDELVRTVDYCEDLQAALEADGTPLMPTRSGTRAHPAAVELRNQRLLMARLIAALRIPDEQAEGRRPQRRGRPRGTYGIQGALS